jgi:hypothetical protein
MSPLLSRLGVGAISGGFGFGRPRGGPVSFIRVLTSGSISGSPTVGSVLTYTLATFEGSTIPTVTYIWYSGASQVASNVTTYTVQNSDLGNTITLVATAVNSFGTISSTSNGITIPIPFATFTVDIWAGDGGAGYISVGGGAGGVGGGFAQGGYARYQISAPIFASMKFYVGEGAGANSSAPPVGYTRGGNTSSVGGSGGGGGGGNSSAIEYATSPSGPYTWLAVVGGGGGAGVDLNGGYNSGGRGNGYGDGEGASGSGGSQGSPSTGGNGVRSPDPNGPQLSGAGGGGAGGGSAGSGSGGGGGGAGNQNPAISIPGGYISRPSSTSGSPNHPNNSIRSPTDGVNGRIHITTEPGSSIQLDSGTFTYPINSFK